MFHQLSLQVGVKHNSLNQNNINQKRKELSSKNELTIGRTDKCTFIEISAFKVTPNLRGCLPEKKIRTRAVF